MSDGVGPRRAACADLSGGATGRVASRLFDADRLSKIEAMSLVRLRVPSVLVATCNGCATVRSADAGRDALDCSGAPADEYCADIMHTVYWAAGHDKRVWKSAHPATVETKRMGKLVLVAGVTDVAGSGAASRAPARQTCIASSCMLYVEALHNARLVAPCACRALEEAVYHVHILMLPACTSAAVSSSRN